MTSDERKRHKQRARKEAQRSQKEAEARAKEAEAAAAVKEREAKKKAEEAGAKKTPPAPKKCASCYHSRVTISEREYIATAIDVACAACTCPTQKSYNVGTY